VTTNILKGGMIYPDGSNEAGPAEFSIEKGFRARGPGDNRLWDFLALRLWGGRVYRGCGGQMYYGTMSGGD